MWVCAFFCFSFLVFSHIYETIVEGLYFHCNLSLCVCVYVCVCPTLLVNKIPAEWMNRFGRGFCLMIAYRTGSNPIEIGDLGSKVNVTVT